MKNTLLAFFVLLVICSSFCQGCKNKTQKRENQNILYSDFGIFSSDNYSDKRFDSLRLRQLTSEIKEIRPYSDSIFTFYKNRDFQFAWFSSGKDLSEQSGKIIDYIRGRQSTSGSDSSRAILPELQQLYSEYMSSDGNIPDSSIARLEVLLTGNFFSYVDKSYKKAGKDKLALGWFIPGKKIDQKALLNKLANTKGDIWNDSSVVYKQYALLRKFLQEYYKIENKGGWPVDISVSSTIKQGDSTREISKIKRRLHITGEYSSDDTSNVFNDELEKAVRLYQIKQGLENNGIISKTLVQKMNIPVKDRIEQILVNMERCLWMPPIENEKNYLFVNIPEYTLHVHENKKEIWSCPVVVGKATANTVVFKGDLKYIVFSPYWNVPGSIVNKEMLPKIIGNADYIPNHNLEVVDKNGNAVNPGDINWGEYSGGNFPYSIKQKPGPNNSLGKVKFLFPNQYNIYLHDTPAKSLFAESNRMLSHGCIRVQKPFELAEFLLNKDSNWSSEKISEAMNAGVEKTVTLSKTVPVYIVYFTSWVDAQGNLNFRDDIYGKDKHLRNILFSN